MTDHDYQNIPFENGIAVLKLLYPNIEEDLARVDYSRKRKTPYKCRQCRFIQPAPNCDPAEGECCAEPEKRPRRMDDKACKLAEDFLVVTIFKNSALGPSEFMPEIGSSQRTSSVEMWP